MAGSLVKPLGMKNYTLGCHLRVQKTTHKLCIVSRLNCVDYMIKNLRVIYFQVTKAQTPNKYFSLVIISFMCPEIGVISYKYRNKAIRKANTFFYI